MERRYPCSASRRTGAHARHRSGAQARRQRTRSPLNPRTYVMNTHTAILALALATLGSSALAHGPQAHRPTHVIKEQKPWGIAAEPGAARRTITIAMDDDMRFKPDVIDVREGETVRLAIRNRGKLLHELVIGTQQALDEHAALMVKFPTMQH